MNALQTLSGDDFTTDHSDSGNDIRSSFGTIRPSHPCRQKRSWSEQKDVVLIEVLIELHNTGRYRVDRGFKSGLYAALEKELDRKLPDSRIRADPHIYSRMKTLKSYYNIVHNMVYQNSSGFGWDPVNKCVTADDAVWTAYLQTHKTAGQFRSRQFKYFDELAIIFGVDRANGCGATDHLRAASQVSDDSDGPIEVSSDELPYQSNGESGGDRSGQQSPVYSKRRKLTREEVLLTAMKDNTTMIVASMDRSTDKIFAAITRSEVHDKRVTMTQRLREMPSLTNYLRNEAHRIIGCDKDLLDVFSTVNAEDLAAWVQQVLERFM